MAVKLRVQDHYASSDGEHAEQLARLDAFRGLQPGWDSYGAEPPSEAAIENARRILQYLWHRDSTLQLRLAPSVEGGVGIIFSGSRNKYADIECFNDGEILAITSETGAEPSVWSVDVETESLRIAVDQINSFLNG